jgi:hypothetical protein
MSLSLPKLQRLWKHSPATSEKVIRRYGQIETIVRSWDEGRAAMPEYVADVPASKEGPKGIPEGSWPIVKQRLREYYMKHAVLLPHARQIDEVSDLLHIQSRDPHFRVSSNASGDADHESDTTSVLRSNPESFFVSYNFPFEVIRFYHSCKSKPETDKLAFCRGRRFNMKFLWMLANRDEHLPIFSLHSFRELVPLFESQVGDLESLTLEEFAKVWPDVSKALCQEIIGQTYSILTPEQKRKLQTLIFMSSLESTTTKNAFDMLQTGNKALILYGPPGTGKTFQAKKVAKQMLLPNEATKQAFEVLQFGKLAASTDDQSAFQHGCWELVQFHPSYSYQDFMGGILPSLDQGSGSLNYKLNEGIFMRFCKAAEKSKKAFVLIIDEINRADLSSVFGELMYALEYRGGKIQVTHFGGFSIPENVYLIGTMNTADKSLVSFDLALRRRFTFLRLAPDLECLIEWGAEKDVKFSPEDMQELIKRAKALNDYLIKSPNGPKLQTDVAIGQAYFMKVREFCQPDEDGGVRILTTLALEQLWDFHLEPLIEEYLGADMVNHTDPLKKQREVFTSTLTTEG